MAKQARRDLELQQPSEKQKSIWEAVEFIDNRLKDKVAEETQKRRQHKDPDLFKDRDEEMEEMIGNLHLPSSLERQRVRQLKEYKDQIDNIQFRITNLKEEGK